VQTRRKQVNLNQSEVTPKARKNLAVVNQQRIEKDREDKYRKSIQHLKVREKQSQAQTFKVEEMFVPSGKPDQVVGKRHYGQKTDISFVIRRDEKPSVNISEDQIAKSVETALAQCLDPSIDRQDLAGKIKQALKNALGEQVREKQEPKFLKNIKPKHDPVTKSTDLRKSLAE
jgi:hypothetical protein